MIKEKIFCAGWNPITEKAEVDSIPVEELLKEIKELEETMVYPEHVIGELKRQLKGTSPSAPKEKQE